MPDSGIWTISSGTVATTIGCLAFQSFELFVLGIHYTIKFDDGSRWYSSIDTKVLPTAVSSIRTVDSNCCVDLAYVTF